MYPVKTKQIIINRGGNFSQSLTRDEISRFSLSFGGEFFGQDFIQRAPEALAGIGIGGVLSTRDPIRIEYTDAHNVNHDCALRGLDCVSMFKATLKRKADYSPIHPPSEYRIPAGCFPPGVATDNVATYRHCHPNIEFNQISDSAMTISSQIYDIVNITINLLE